MTQQDVLRFPVSAAARSPLLLLALCGLVFAARIMISKAALNAGMQPFQLALVANVGAGMILLPWLAVSRQSIPHELRHVALYLVLGIISFTIPTVLSYFIVERVGPAYTSTVYSLSPLVTMTFAAGFGIERMYLRRFAGIVVGLAGMVALVQQQLAQIDFSQTEWVVLGLAIPACAALGNIIRSAFWPKGTSALAFSCGILISSSLLVGLLAPVFEAPLGWTFSEPAVLFWMACMIGTSALSYLLNFKLQEIGGPVFFSQLGYWGTGFGVLMAAFLFNDVLTALSVAGLAAIILGGVLANRRRAD
ncbi:DMT family transporter [Aminobacter sp. AP02]|uniref:DMT family transporter n=1 Tax=Aminobacter sp. AP02 TaxID=2135737 RepID=UPI000D6AC074|nr:DMT family transporter [Aminobacter sp. AP02]PWK75664.1 EamA-like transporter family protein [Aminobacter sp. AP02]